MLVGYQWDSRMTTVTTTDSASKLRAQPLTASAFAPFGEVLEPPASAGRSYFEDALANRRPSARPSLSLSRVMPSPAGPLIARVMERHEHSSQSFIALEAARWLVMVAPSDAAGSPDMARAEAFVCGQGQGITYRADVWHHPLTVLDAPASFAVFMWRDGSAGDEEFVDIGSLLVDSDGVMP
jgi:ureidoglycolate lyase